MPSYKELQADSDYAALPDSDKMKVLAGLDPDYASLDPQDKVTAFGMLEGEKSNLSKRHAQYIHSDPITGMSEVSRVIDGDTMMLGTGDKVRLLGVDTPETQHPKKPVQYFGKEATAFTRREIEHRPVDLEYDNNRRDKYDRLLAYVKRNPDNYFLNAELIKNGFGFAYTDFPFKYKDEFLRYQEQAKAEGRGIWHGVRNSHGNSNALVGHQGHYDPDKDDKPALVSDQRVGHQGNIDPMDDPNKEMNGSLHSFLTGLSKSSSGLALGAATGKPAPIEYAPKGMAERLAHGAGQIVGDLPAMIAGGAAASGGGPVVAMGGAFALPAAIKHVYEHQLENGRVKNYDEFLDLLKTTQREAGKEGLLGLATGGAGAGAVKAFAPVAKGGLKELLLRGSAEVPTMVVGGKVIHPPPDGSMAVEPEEFAEAALLMLGMHGAVKAGGKVSEAFGKGKESLKDILMKGDVPPPEAPPGGPAFLKERTDVDVPADTKMKFEMKAPSRDIIPPEDPPGGSQPSGDLVNEASSGGGIGDGKANVAGLSIDDIRKLRNEARSKGDVDMVIVYDEAISDIAKRSFALEWKGRNKPAAEAVPLANDVRGLPEDSPLENHLGDSKTIPAADEGSMAIAVLKKQLVQAEAKGDVDMMKAYSDAISGLEEQSVETSGETPIERGVEDVRKTLGNSERSLRDILLGEGKDMEAEKLMSTEPDSESPAVSDPKAKKPMDGKPGSKGVTLTSGIDITEPVKNFYAQDIKPAVRNSASGIVKIADSLMKVFDPVSRSEEAGATGGIIRHKTGEMARETELVAQELEKHAKAMGKMDVDEQLSFIDAIETNKPHIDPVMSSAAKVLRDMVRKRWRIVQKMSGVETFNEDYFPHLWKKGQDEKIAEFVKKHSLGGDPAALKKRTIPTIKEGIAYSLEPETTNPVELTMMKVRELDKYINGFRIVQELAERGIGKLIGKGGQVPYGYVKLDGRVAKDLAKSMADGKGGELYVPATVSDVLNNFLAPGLRGNAIYDAVHGVSNAMNQAQLSMSAFHLGFTSLDVVVSGLSLGIKEALGGRGLGGLNPLKLGALPVTNYRRGDKLYKAYFEAKPGEHSALVEALELAGGRVKMDPFYHNGATKGLVKAFNNKNPIGVMARMPGTAVEKLSWLLMEVIVPRQKLGVFADMVNKQWARWRKDGHEPTTLEKREAFGKFWDSVDNRLGELVYDNLFWNKAVKDISFILTRSVGWTLGSIREILGGVLDLKDIRFSKKNGMAITDRTAYVIALPIMTGIMGAIYGYLMGHRPEEPFDYFFPWTGKYLANGEKERVSLPTYMKDIYAFKHDPGATAIHKSGPLLSATIEAMTNKDFFGVEVRHQDDPFMAQLADVSEFLVKQFVPFTIRNFEQRKDQGATNWKAGQSIIGITPAPASVTNSDALNMASNLAGKRMPNTAITKEQQEAHSVKNRVAAIVREKKPVPKELKEKLAELGSPAAKAAYKAGSISRLEELVKHLTAKEAMKVWDVARDDERKKIKNGIYKKLAIAVKNKTILLPEYRGYVKQLRNIK